MSLKHLLVLAFVPLALASITRDRFDISVSDVIYGQSKIRII
jgi:hypothetical protein